KTFGQLVKKFYFCTRKSVLKTTENVGIVKSGRIEIIEK
ncbi:hypothetical protein SAMN05421800_1537, partial [Chryseobacterium balustinum]